MKRVISWICGVSMCLTMLIAPAGAFSDVTDKTTAIATDTLAYMDIIGGYGDGRYNPQGDVTRAEFCKIIMSTTEKPEAIMPYKNYTIFEDVKYTHWASAYINMAVQKKVEGSDEKAPEMIIKGYPDGTFLPENNITMGEAVSIALRVLGYKTKDVGMFWPNDYVAKGREIGLLTDVKTQTNSPLTRGDAAILIYNMLLTNNKQGTMFLKAGSFKLAGEDMVILSDSTTDVDLTDKQVRASTLVAGEDKAPIYTIHKPFPKSLMGQKGIMILGDEQSSGGIKGFVPYRSTKQEYVIGKTTALAITTTDETKISVKTSIPVVIGGQIKTYGKCFYDLLPGNNITIYYDKNGNMESISLSSGISNLGPYMLTSDGTGGNPLVELFGYNGGTVYKNGSKIEVKNLKKYDVVTYDKSNNSYYVTDAKLSGLLEDANPALQAPNTVTVFSQELQVIESAKKDFEKLKIGDNVTLFLTSDNKVAGVAPASVYQTNQYAVVKSASGTTAKLNMLPNNKEISVTTDADYAQFTGQVVKVYTGKNGKVAISKATLSPTQDSFNVKERRLGDKAVSGSVKIFEQFQDFEATLIEIPLESIKYTDEIAAKDINGVICDTSGTPLVIVLKNVTGEAYTYGKVTVKYGGKDENGNKVEVSRGIENITGEKIFTGTATTPFVVGGVAIDGNGRGVDSATLESLGKVSLTDFQTTEYVKVGAKLIPIADNVTVLIEKTGKFMELDKAKSLCSEFEVFINPDVKNKNVIRYIKAN